MTDRYSPLQYTLSNILEVVQESMVWMSVKQDDKKEKISFPPPPEEEEEA
jgi:hypothetical protein